MMAVLLGVVVALATQAPVMRTPDVEAKLREIAFQAAREGDSRTLTEYFASGGAVNELNSRGDTLLIVAAYAGEAEAATVILAQPETIVDARNQMGLSALTAAAFQGHVEIARTLVLAGAEVNLANASGQTALMFAALGGRTAMVEFLIAAKADVGAVDRQGKSALALAEQQGAKAAAALLKAAASSR